MAWIKRISNKKKSSSKKSTNKKEKSAKVREGDAPFPRRQNRARKPQTRTIEVSVEPSSPLNEVSPTDKDDRSKNGKTKEKKPKSKSNLRVRKGGNKMENPLVDGIPFWVILPKANEEDTDNQTLIDSEFIENVVDGKIVLDPVFYEPRRFFDPFASIQRLKQADKYFNEHNILAASVRTVAELTSDAESDAEGAVPSSFPSLTIEWAKTITVVDLDSNSHMPVRSYQQPFCDIKRKK